MTNVSDSLMFRKKGEDPRGVGLWKVGKQLGSGASGRVRLARHSKSGQYAAIKIVPKQRLGSRVTINRMADEAEHTQLAIEREIVVMKLLDHPNVLRLYDVWETSTELYLVLEYVQGGELFEYLCNHGKLPVPEALNYFQQIISAMDYCHRFNIAHRDLKPENILLDKDFNIKVADFGMAAWQANNDGLLRTSCGSPHYAAPEIISGNVYNGSASDIWSCGVILFALLAGKLPFDDEDCVILLRKVKTGKYETPTDMHPLAKDLISKMLTLDATQRITMPEIMAHPFFKLHPLRLSANHAPSLATSAHPMADKSLIDPDIFANLRTLWHGFPEEQIIESLTSSEPTLQKGIYHLLVQYRTNNANLYQDEEEKIVRDRLERKKSKKAKAIAAALERLESTENNSSPTLFPPRDGPPTPRRALRRHHASIPSLELFRPAGSTGQVQTPSPNTSATPPLNVLPRTSSEFQDDRIQSFFRELTQRLDVPQTDDDGHSFGLDVDSKDLIGENLFRNTLPLSVNINQGEPITPKTVNGTKPLSVGRKTRRPKTIVDDDKENIGGGDLRKRGRARKGEKRVRVLQTAIKERIRKGKVSPSPVASETSSWAESASGPFSLPAFSSPPKRSWLANVFNFRPPPLSLFSTHDIQTTRNECRRLLMAMHVWVVLEDSGRFGVLKCRLNEVKEPSGVMNLLKSVKFRVDFQGPHVQGRVGEETLMMSLTVIHEKGSAETFKEVCRRLKREWYLAKMAAGTEAGGNSPGMVL